MFRNFSPQGLYEDEFKKDVGHYFTRFQKIVDDKKEEEQLRCCMFDAYDIVVAEDETRRNHLYDGMWLFHDSTMVRGKASDEATVSDKIIDYSDMYKYILDREVFSIQGKFNFEAGAFQILKFSIRKNSLIAFESPIRFQEHCQVIRSHVFTFFFCFFDSDTYALVLF